MARQPASGASFTQLIAEPLECRRVQATSITANLVGNELQIDGTESSDQIQVGLIGKRIHIAGFGQTFRASDVQSIYISGLGGNDVINLSPQGRGVQAINVEVTVDGGAGNDAIQAGSRSATIRGGAGDDKMLGSRAGDFLYGDDGNDLIIGLRGDDFIDAGAGDDKVNG